MVSWSNLMTLAEIFLAELIFLHSFPKRSRFWLRLIGFFLAAMAIAAFIPDGDRNSAEILDKVYIFFRYMLLFALSVTAMGLTFKTSFSAVLSACAAGYAVQHAASRITYLLTRIFPIASLLGLQFPYFTYAAEAIFMPVIYLLAYLIFGRMTAKRKFFDHHNSAVNVLSVTMVVVCIGISRFPNDYAVLIYPAVMCLFALLVQLNLNRALSLREENAVMHRLMTEESKRYEISKENMDILNIKFHDLKYRLAALEGRLPPEEIESISRAIDIYDRNVKTGSEVMDVILAEKRVRCDGLDITLTCMGDFAALDFMTTVDAYSFFGNALDNAIEAVSRIAEKEKRQISVTVEKRGDPVVVTVSNYYDGEVRRAGGAILTTKEKEPGFHGFGIKSMKRIAQKYSGDLTISSDGSLFSLSAYFMGAAA